MRLLEYLRPALQKSPEIRAVQKGLQVGIDELWDAVESAREQLDIETATWGLSVWEEALGIPVETEKAADFRRSRIRAKLRGQGTTTVEALRNVAASFSNGEVAVTEIPAQYRVEINFVGAVGLPPNLDDLKAAIAEILPAHLAVGYVSTLKSWNDVKDMTWAEAAGLTWEQLRGGTV